MVLSPIANNSRSYYTLSFCMYGTAERNLIFIGTCTFVIAENNRPTWCHLLFLFRFLRAQHVSTLIYPSSGACDYSVELPRWSCVLGSMCVGVSMWLGYHANPTTLKIQHTSNQEHTTIVVIQQNSRKLLMMDILMSETCWAHKKWTKKRVTSS